MTEEFRLTKTDVVALRKADDVSFFTSFSFDVSHGYPIPQHSSEIICTQRTPSREREKDPFAPYEKRYAFGCAASIAVYPHGGYSTGAKIEPTKGFASTGGYSEAWRTIAAIIRSGDILQLDWACDCGNQYTSGKDLHHDSLSLRVIREGKTGKRTKMIFRVEDSICEQNTARMIQGRYPEPRDTSVA